MCYDYNTASLCTSIQDHDKDLSFNFYHQDYIGGLQGHYIYDYLYK